MIITIMQRFFTNANQKNKRVPFFIFLLVFLGLPLSVPKVVSAVVSLPDLVTNELRILTPLAQGGKTYDENLTTTKTEFGVTTSYTTDPVGPVLETVFNDVKKDSTDSFLTPTRAQAIMFSKEISHNLFTFILGDIAFATPGSTITMPNATAEQGQKIHIFAKILNTGTADAVTNFNNQFSYQYGGTSGSWTPFPLTTTTYAQLPVTGKAVDGANVTVPNISGTLYIRHCLDINNTVPELNEDNCTISPGITVGAIPDLVSQNLTLSAGPYTQGTPISLSATVRNNGTGSTGVGFSDNFTYQWNGTGGTWNNFSGNTVAKAALAAGATSADGPVSFTPGQGGTLYIQHCVDSTNAIAEGGNETPNCTVSAGVAVVALTVPTLTTPTHSGLTSTGATLGATITGNGGSAITARGTCWGTTTNPTTNCSPEGGTAISTFTQVRTSMNPGTLIYYRGYADNVVGRGYSPSSSFTTLSLPDLTSANTSPAANTNFFTTDTIVFQGTANNSNAATVAEGGWADVEVDWNSDGSFTNYNAYNGVKLGAFALNEPKNLFSFSPNPPVGTHRYRFNVDTDGTGVVESNEGNNRSSWVTFTVTLATSCPAATIDNCVLQATPSGNSNGGGTSCVDPTTNGCSYRCMDGTWNLGINSCNGLPDYVVRNHRVTTPGPYIVGTPITVEAETWNIGTAPPFFPTSPEFSIQWNGTGGPWTNGIGYAMPGLYPGEMYSLTYTYTPTQSGTLYSQYCVDPLNSAKEGANETPNCSVISVAVVSPTIPTFEICNDGGGGCVTAGGTKTADPGAPLDIVWDSDNTTACDPISGNGFATGGATFGTDDIMASTSSNAYEEYKIACRYNSGTPVQSTAIVVTNIIIPDLTASLRTVEQGDSITLTWDTNNGDDTSCSLTGGGIDGAALLGNGTGTNETGSASVVIMGRTTFILTCNGLSNVKTIEIIPSSWEG